MKELAAAILVAASSGGFATLEQEACAAAFHSEGLLANSARFAFDQVHRHVTLTIPGDAVVMECYFRELGQEVPELVRFTFTMSPDRQPVDLDVQDLNRKIWEHFN